VNRHEMTRLLVPPGDPDALAVTLNRILRDHELRGSLGRAARERVEREFTAEQMIARTVALYDQVVSRSDRHTLISA
jgi:glycosyltransferase involved in cell wall biosynthesis